MIIENQRLNIKLPIFVYSLVSEDGVEELSHIPDLLGHSVAVHNIQDTPGRAGEIFHQTASYSLMTRDINQVNAGSALNLQGDDVVDHGGVSIPITNCKSKVSSHRHKVHRSTHLKKQLKTF